MDQEILKLIDASFANDNEKRTKAEEALAHCDGTQDFPRALLMIGLNEEVGLQYRQSASVLLKNWIDYHWTSTADKFKEPEASEETKEFIRHGLPRGLANESRAVRNVFAAALSIVAGWEWPETWPDFVPNLIDALNSDNANMVDGALRCLKEFSTDINGKFAPEMIQSILPKLLEFMTPNSGATPIMAARSLQILTTLTMLISDARAKTLEDQYEKILTVFRACILRPVEEEDDWLIKRNVFNCFNELVKGFSKKVAPLSAHCLQDCWTFIAKLSKQYLATAINSDETESQEDSDSETAGIQGTVMAAMEFLCTIIEKKAFTKVVQIGIPPLIPSLMIFLQASAGQINAWEDDPDRFVEEEDDEVMLCSVRTIAMDLLLCVAKDFLGVLLPPLLEYVGESQSGSASWQQRESAYYIIGAVASALEEEHMTKFNIQGYLEGPTLRDLKSGESPFLTGRALWFSARFANKVPANLLQAFLEATAHGLQNGQSPIVRIQAARAVYEFITNIPLEKRGILGSFVTQALGSLIEMCSTAPTEVSCLLLEVITECINIEDDNLDKFGTQLTDLILSTLQSNNSDPHVCAIVEDMVESLGKRLHPEVIGSFPTIFSAFVPYLVHIMKTPENEIGKDADVSNSFIAICLDITTRFVRSIPKPLPEDLLRQLYPVIVEKTLQSSDTQVVQSGGEAVRGFFASAGDQICAMEHGLEAAERVILHLLEPNSPEYSASFAGRLVCLILLNTKSQNLENILSAVLLKLNTASTLTVQQALLLVFARLASADTMGLVNFLDSKNALQPLMQLWLEKQGEVFGAYERKVTVAGLCSLLALCANGEERLVNLTLRKKIEDNSGGRSMRSKKKEEKFVEVSFSQITLETLASEWAGQKEREDDLEEILDEDDEDYDEDSSGEVDFDDRSESQVNHNTAILLSELLAGRGDLEDLEGEEEDDVKSDPLHGIKLCEHISEQIRNLATSSLIRETASHLDETNRKILEKVITA